MLTIFRLHSARTEGANSEANALSSQRTRVIRQHYRQFETVQIQEKSSDERRSGAQAEEDGGGGRPSATTSRSPQSGRWSPTPDLEREPLDTAMIEVMLCTRLCTVVAKWTGRPARSERTASGGRSAIKNGGIAMFGDQGKQRHSQWDEQTWTKPRLPWNGGHSDG